MDGSLSFFPDNFLGGKHEFKTGTTLYWQRAGNGTLINPAGNYVLVYDREQPVEIRILNAPTQPVNAQDIYAAYFKDTWRIANSLTANLGVRLEYQHCLRAGTSERGEHRIPDPIPCRAVPLPGRRYLVQRRASRRFGVELSGPKTVVKGSYGRYNAGMIGEGGFAQPYNTNGSVTATYRWTDRDGNGDYTPGDVNLDLNGPDFLSITGSANNRINPNLRQPMTNEMTAGFEREVASNLGFRAMYVYKDFRDSLVSVNVARPRSAYNIPLTRRDPGPDGVLDTADDGGNVTIWDYDPAYRRCGVRGQRAAERPADR